MFAYSAKVFFVATVALITTAFTIFAKSENGRLLDGKLHHIGDSEIDYWPEVSKKPDGAQLDVRFTATKNKKAFTVSLIYWDVNYPAAVELNGKKIDELATSQHRKLGYVTLPAGSLKPGTNVLSILPRAGDDCVIGKVTLYEESFQSLMRLQPVRVSVTDAATGRAVPARITITDLEGNHRQIFFAQTNRMAVRTGIIYTTGAETPFQLSEGDYFFYATRGMEWSRAQQKISVKHGKTTEVKLAIRREVDTKGFVAADTHIHTLTFSGHGDASVEERMVTLAGEGVELAISTDHNHQTDYRPYQQKLGLNEYFTPVTGNEVTTKIGHFNGFPLPPSEDIPDFKETNWVKLVDGIRAKGAKVVILNHPHWDKLPALEIQGFNHVTGERASGAAVTFDAMELCNSTTLVSNLLTLCGDWFRFLNYGERVAVVGSSDTHSVDDPVGQGRTYIRSSTDEAAKIDVDEACKNILAGDMSVSMGIFAEATVNGRFKMGQVAPMDGSPIKVQLRVAAPSWVKPQRALVFLNGSLVGEQTVKVINGKATDQVLEFSIPAPRHDAYVVCVVLGEPVKAPCWETLDPYTMAASNPIYLDADNDGRYRSPRETARMILEKTPGLDDQWKAVVELDDGTAVQMLDLVFKSSDAKSRETLREKLEASVSGRKIYEEFLKSMKSSAPALPGS
jgi:hypothetical protein